MAISTAKFISNLKGKTEDEITNIYRINLGVVRSGKDKHLAGVSKPRVSAMLEAYPYLEGVSLCKDKKDSPVAEGTHALVPDNTDEYVARKYIQILESAKKRGKGFNLELSDIEEIVKETKCYYTEVTLTNTKGCNFQRTVDRIDNREGYVKGNVVACSHLANKLKNDLFENPSSSVFTNIKFMASLLIKVHKKLKESK
jgi:hypothetical protein